MRTLIELNQEQQKNEEKIEKGKKHFNGDFGLGKAIGESLQLEIIRGDYHELLEWIKGHKEDSVPKDTLISKIQGEVIG